MITYRTRGDIQYAEIACAECRVTAGKYVVNAEGLEFYEESQPGVPYLCPTHRLARDPDARLYAAVSGLSNVTFGPGGES
jgi:hypothetical protein